METVAGVLAFGTMGFVMVFAYISARALEKHRKSDAPKSALSRDGIEERLAKIAKSQ